MEYMTMKLTGREDMDTIGKRIRLAMLENNLRQSDVREQLRSYGKEISKANLSKIVNDGAIMYTPDLLEAMGKILGVNLHYLLTGEEIEGKEEKFNTDEANRAGAAIDALPQEMRELLTNNALMFQRLSQSNERLIEENKTLRSEKEALIQEHEKLRQQYYRHSLEMKDLLERSAISMEENHRKLAAAHIARIDRHIL